MYGQFSRMMRRIIPGCNNVNKTMGRWSTETEPGRLHARIDWANEDHCGACGNPFKEMENDKQKKNNMDVETGANKTE